MGLKHIVGARTLVFWVFCESVKCMVTGLMTSASKMCWGVLKVCL